MLRNNIHKYRLDMIRSLDQGKLLLIFCCLEFLVGTSLYADDPKPFKHEKQIYVDQNKDIYVGVRQPLFLTVSSSGQKDGVKIPLYSKGDTIRGKIPLPFKAKRGGKHKIYYMDLYDKGQNNKDREGLFEINVDDLSPETKFIYNGSTKHRVHSKMIIYGSNLEVSLKAEDIGSGLKGSFYSINGSNFKYFQKSIPFENEGLYIVRAYSVDKVGNAEEIKTSEFRIDKTAPKSSMSWSNIRYKDIASPVSNIVLKAKDDYAGVGRIFYSFSGFGKRIKGKWSGKPISLKGMKQGNWNFTWYSQDNVGNVERTQSISFYLDVTPPKANLAVIGVQHKKSSKTYISLSAKIKLNASDNKAGVEKIQYLLEKGRYKSYKKPFSLPAKHGLHSVSVLSHDKVANVSSQKISNYYMDLRLPKTYHYFIGQSYKKDKYTYISNQTRISFRGKDEDSGIKKVYYRIDNESPKEFRKPFRITVKGACPVKFYSEDQVGNKELARKLNLFVDEEPPEIYFRQSIKRIGVKTIDDTKVGVYPKGTSVYLAATDDASGIDTISWILNGQKSDVRASHIKLKSRGLHTIVIKAVDLVGNLSVKNLNIIID